MTAVECRAPYDGEYTNKLKETIGFIISAAENHDGWNLLKERNGISVYSLVDDQNPIKKGKAGGIVQGTPDEVLTLLQGIEYYHEIDPFFKSGRVIQHFDENHEVLYSHYSLGVPLVSDRDFVYMEGRQHCSDGSKVVAAFSVDRPDSAPVKGLVRAHIHQTGWYIKPCEPTHQQKLDSDYSTDMDGPFCKITFFAQVDLKGWFPAWLLNQLITEISKSILQVRSHLPKLRTKLQK